VKQVPARFKVKNETSEACVSQKLSSPFINSVFTPSEGAWLDKKAGSCHATCQLCWLSEHGQRSAAQSAELEETFIVFTIRNCAFSKEKRYNKFVIVNAFIIEFVERDTCKNHR
jgi:hypothetical protein